MILFEKKENPQAEDDSSVGSFTRCCERWWKKKKEKGQKLFWGKRSKMAKGRGACAIGDTDSWQPQVPPPL